MLNLDPNLINQDKIRLKKRKKLLLISAAPLVAFLVISIFFIRTGIYNIALSMDSGGREYNMTLALTGFQKVGNVLEPYIVYYNNGYIKLLNASSRPDLLAAEDYFKESLKNDPPEKMLCAVYGNLSYTIELQAKLDEEEGDYDAAVTKLYRAEGILYENGCAEKDSTGKTGKDEKSEAAKRRINEERRKVIAAANNDTDNPEDDNNDGNDGTPQYIDEDTLQKIKERQSKVEELGGSTLRIRQITSGGGASYFGVGDPRF